MNLYQNKSEFKVIVLIVALTIGLASLYYTNFLINQLVEREKKQMELIGEAHRFLVDRAINESVNFIFTNIIQRNETIPMIVTDKEGSISAYRNIHFPEGASEEKKQKILEKQLEIMKNEQDENPPILIQSKKPQFIYYRNSDLIYQLRYYPIAQLSVIAIFGLLTYLVFSSLRKAEQNRVWVGLAKETAHQLGTPISSLMAWLEYLKEELSTSHSEVLTEIDKDIKRLEMITARFSNIGSQPTIADEPLHQVMKEIISYLRPRISTRVDIQIINYLPTHTYVSINRYLFEWVIENLCKNAVDAMNGIGKIDVHLSCSANQRKVFIDIADSGKGIPKSKIKKVFYPGYTTKKRGWGLGLTLAKRIIEDYHKGKIFVKNSEVDKGTKFRIILGINGKSLMATDHPMSRVLRFPSQKSKSVSKIRTQ